MITILKACKDGANNQIFRYKYALTCYYDIWLIAKINEYNQVWLRNQTCLLLCIQVWFPAMSSVYGRPSWSSESSLWAYLLSKLHQAVADPRADVLSTLHAWSWWWLWPQAIRDHSVSYTHWNLTEWNIPFVDHYEFLSCQSYRGYFWAQNYTNLFKLIVCFWLLGPWSKKMANSESSAMPSSLTSSPLSASETTRHPIKLSSVTCYPSSWWMQGLYPWSEVGLCVYLCRVNMDFCCCLVQVKLAEILTWI